MTVDELRRKSNMELRELALKKGQRGNASMDAKKAQRELEQRGWADVPHRPSLLSRQSILILPRDVASGA